MQGEMDTYLDKVGNQIRWKAARKLVRQELQGHIEEKKRDALAESPDTTEAEHMAVEAMGDPAETGRKLDKLHRPKLDIWLLASIAVLIAFGIVILNTISLNFDVNYYGGWFILRMVGLALGIACVFIDFRWLMSKSISLIIMGCIGLAGMLFVNFTDNWGYQVWGELGIGFDGLSFISYICMILVIIAAAGLASRVRKNGWIGLLCVIGLILGIAALNLFRQNRHLVITFGLVLAVIPMIWTSRAKTLWKALATAAITAFIAVFFGEYILTVLTNPTAYQYLSDTDTAYIQQHIQSIQWIGQAPGVMTGDLAYTNVLLYAAFQFGLFPTITLLGVLGILIWRIIRACLRIHDVSGRILATGLVTFVTALIIANLVFNAMLVYISGSYLPFLSNYGVAYVLAPVILGIILGLYRKKDLYPAKELDSTENKSILFG